MSDLTEALETYERGLEKAPTLASGEFMTVFAAARRWDALDSDENVEVAAKALCLWAMGEGVWEKDYQDMWRDQARAALGAVKAGEET